MVSLSSLRDKINQRIFTADLKSTAVIASLTSQSTDKWGDEQSSYSAGTNIEVVPYLYTRDRLNYQPFGDAQEGEVDFVIKYDVTVNVSDRITWQGESYFIVEIDNSAFLGNGLVVQVVRCRRTK